MRGTPITIIMAYFKKTDSLTGKPKKEKRASFSSFPKSESSDDTKPKKKKPFGKPGGEFYEKKKRKPLGEDELPASRGFYKSKTGYNSPSAPWNREKKVEEKKSYGEESRGNGTQANSPVQGGRPKTFEKKWVLRDPTAEVEHENNPANYGAAKLQFRRVSKRAQRSFSKNKERAYEEQKGLKLDTPTPKASPKSYVKVEQVEEKKKFMHGKWKPVKKWESRWALTERVEKPKAKKKPNPKPFKAAMPSNWRKVGE